MSGAGVGLSAIPELVSEQPLERPVVAMLVVIYSADAKGGTERLRYVRFRCTYVRCENTGVCHLKVLQKRESK